MRGLPPLQHPDPPLYSQIWRKTRWGSQVCRDSGYMTGRRPCLGGVQCKAYDSDGLDARCRRRRVRMITPHRKGRVKPNTQDGRELRRYKRRWKIERVFAWMKNFRRLCNRWEYKSVNFLGFAKLAAIVILMRN
ncbi:MAG: transposase [Fibrobacteria bacterium]